MLGEILGRRAGDASTELLNLFLEPRGASVGVLRDPFASVIGSIWGLWVADTDPLGREKAGDGGG